MVIKNKYNLGQIVWLITDSQQQSRQVVSIKIDIGGCLMYMLVAGETVTWHYEAEIQPEADKSPFLMN